MIFVYVLLAMCSFLQAAEQSRLLTVSFSDQTAPYQYTASPQGRWDQKWSQDIQISQRNDLVLGSLSALIDGDDQKVKGFWQTTWKDFNVLQKSLLLELIYAMGAQDTLLPANDLMQYILELDWHDNRAKLYMPVNKDELSQFLVLPDMIEATNLGNRLVPITMQYDTDFEKDHALKSLKILFDFAHNVSQVKDVSTLQAGQKLMLRTLFLEASSKECLQALLWANKFGIIPKKVQLLVDMYVEVLCKEIMNNVSVRNITIIGKPEELKNLVFESLLKKINELYQDMKVLKNAAHNIVQYSSTPALKEEALYEANWLSSSIETFEKESNQKIVGITKRKNIEEALLFYKLVDNKKIQFGQKVPNVQNVTAQTGIKRVTMKTYNWYSALSNSYKTGLKWLAGITAGLGLVGIAALSF